MGDENARNVFILTADSLRADVSTSWIQEIAERVDGVNFTNAVATANATAHSLPTLAFGVYRDAVGRRLTTDEVTTLAERLSEEEYETSLWTDNRVFGPERNFDRGFSNSQSGEDTWKQTAQDLVKKTNSQRLFDLAQHVYFNYGRRLIGLVEEDYHYPPAEHLHEQVLEHLESSSEDSQLHWIHYMDTHHPFEPPQEYVDRREFNRNATRNGLADLSSKTMISNMGEGLTKVDLEDVWQAYLASCDYWFDEVSRFVEELIERGHFDPALDCLVVSSDHGEGFDIDKHEMLGHTPTPAFWEELVRVPLVVSRPDWDSATVDGQVSLIDLVPTILDGVGVDVPDSVAGIAAAEPQDMIRDRAFFTAEGPERTYHGVRDQSGWKLFADRVRIAGGNEIMADDEAPDRERVLLTNYAGTEETVIFERELDSSTEPEDPEAAAVYSELADALQTEKGGMVTRGSGESIDEDLEEQLRDLGYVSDV